MDVEVKKGKKIIKRTGFSPLEVEIKMRELLLKHKHICTNCCSTDCKGSRNLKSDIIVRGIRTLDRDFIFECTGYKPILTENDSLKMYYMENGNIVDSPMNYAPEEYTISNPKVKSYIRRLR